MEQVIFINAHLSRVEKTVSNSAGIDKLDAYCIYSAYFLYNRAENFYGLIYFAEIYLYNYANLHFFCTKFCKNSVVQIFIRDV